LTGIVIVCILALVLSVLLFTPIRILASYEGGEIEAELSAAFLRIPLYPLPEKKDKDKDKDKEPPVEAPKKEKKKFSINADQIFYTLEKLPPILGTVLKGVGRRIRISPLRLYVLVAGADPADTAVLYGRLYAALEAGLPVLHRVLRIKEQDIRLFPDFQQDRMDCIARVGISIRLWDILWIALRAGTSLLAWFLAFRKLADAPQTSEKHTDENTAPSADAA